MGGTAGSGKGRRLPLLRRAVTVPNFNRRRELRHTGGAGLKRDTDTPDGSQPCGDHRAAKGKLRLYPHGRRKGGALRRPECYDRTSGGSPSCSTAAILVLRIGTRNTGRRRTEKTPPARRFFFGALDGKPRDAYHRLRLFFETHFRFTDPTGEKHETKGSWITGVG